MIKKLHKYMKYYNFFCTNKVKGKKKKRRLIRNKVKIENAKLRTIK